MKKIEKAIEEIVQRRYEDEVGSIEDIVDREVREAVAREVSEEFDRRAEDLKKHDRERYRVENEVYGKIKKLVDERLPQLVANAVSSKVKEIENDLLVELVRRSLNFQKGGRNESEVQEVW